MNLTIKATHTTQTEAIQNVIEDKLSVLERFLKPQHKVHIEIDVDNKHKSGDVCRVEVTISPDGYYADARGADAYTALDLVIPKIREQLTREKDKDVSLRRRAGARLKRLFFRE